MKAAARTDTIHFSVKGQVVIPRWLRQEFEIEAGTRAGVQSTPEGILLKPVTRASIQRLRGILKRKPGAQPLAQEWAEHKADEQALEEARDGCGSGSR
jgi:bifunctional DNA-binding transcriptional regulator/antitoxin component of YhaV-PrlF toxin-antitoxin module